MIDAQAVVSKYENVYPNSRAETLGLDIEKNHLLNFVREYISYNSEEYQGIKKYITAEHRPFSDKDISLTIFNALDNAGVNFAHLSNVEKETINTLTGKNSEWFIEKSKELYYNLMEPEFREFYKVPQVPDVLKYSCDKAKMYLTITKTNEELDKIKDQIIESNEKDHDNDFMKK